MGRKAEPDPFDEMPIEEVIQRLIKDGAEGAAEYEHHENLKSALSKWYDAWPKLVGHDGKLRTNHKQASTIGGRLSVERWQAGLPVSRSRNSARAVRLGCCSTPTSPNGYVRHRTVLARRLSSGTLSD